MFNLRDLPRPANIPDLGPQTLVRRAYRAKGGQLDLEIYPGEESGFITREAKTAAHKIAGTAKIIAFVHKHLA